MDRLDYAGALSDPLAAIIFCGSSHHVDMTIVNGRIVLRDGKLTRVDEKAIRDRANSIARQMLEAAGMSTEWML